jgi:hypothetical protein
MSTDLFLDTNNTPIDNGGKERQFAQFDVDEYREELKSLDLTPEQEVELLTTIWEMMKCFVELGFGVDSMSLILPDIFNDTSQTPENVITNKSNNRGG